MLAVVLAMVVKVRQKGGKITTKCRLLLPSENLLKFLVRLALQHCPLRHCTYCLAYSTGDSNLMIMVAAIFMLYFVHSTLQPASCGC